MELESLVRQAGNLDPQVAYSLRESIGEAMREQSQQLNALRSADRASYAHAVHTATTAFEARVSELRMKAMAIRDSKLHEVVTRGGHDALLVAERLGFAPAALEYHGKLLPIKFLQDHTPIALEAFADELERSRHARAYDLGQGMIRDILEELQSSGTLVGSTHSAIMRQPATLASPSAHGVLSADDVARLRSGEALILEPPIEVLSLDRMRHVHADLSRLVASMGTLSSAPCNSGSRSTNLPLPQTPDPPTAGDELMVEGAESTKWRGGGYGYTDETCDVLQLLAALPAEIERLGWPRGLVVPPHMQLASYAAESGARYAPHLDRWDHETHNRREITILCYVNCDWQVERDGGCLRLHPGGLNSADGASSEEAMVDVAPVAGKIVVFSSGSMLHEVLPATGGVERLALTLWVEAATPSAPDST